MNNKLGKHQIRYGLKGKKKKPVTKEVNIVQDFQNYKMKSPIVGAKFIPGQTIIELNEEQLAAIDWFIANPPKYYKWFYKLYEKFLGKTIFLSIVLCLILSFVHSLSMLDLFNTIKYIFFFACGASLWSLISHLFKVFYTKRFAKSIGLTLKQWDWVTISQRWDI